MAAASTAARLCPDAHAAVPGDAAAAPPTASRGSTFPSSRIEPAERERLLLQHLPQVRLVAETLRARLRFAMEFEDLLSYGALGLLRAIERYDPARGVLLKTYAEHRIRGAMLDGVRAMDWLPRSARQKERRYQESRTRSEAAQSGSPRMLAERASARFRPKAQLPPLSAPSPIARMELIHAGADLGKLEEMAQQARLRGWLGEVEDTPEIVCQRQETWTRLACAVSRLPRRHRAVIQLYYRRECSMKQIGRMLRIHESRVSQLHAAAIQRLRNALAPDYGIARAKGESGRSRTKAQRPAGEASKRFVTASQSSSVSTPMVSSAVSTT